MTVHAVPREQPVGKKGLKIAETPLGRHLRGLAVAYERASKNPERAAGLRQAADIVDSQVSGEIHHAALLELFHTLLTELSRAIEELRGARASEPLSVLATPSAEELAERPAHQLRRPIDRSSPRRSAPVSGLPSGEAKVLAAVASFKSGATRAQVTMLTGFKRSTRDAYILRLLKASYLRAIDNDRVEATVHGQMMLGPDFKRVPTGKKAADHWESELPSGEALVFVAVREAWPNAISRDEITRRTNFKRSTRDAYLLRLKKRELVDDLGDGIKLRKELAGR